MRLGMAWNRRSFLGTLGMIVGSMMTTKKLFAAKASAKVSGFGQSGNPYEELGVPTVINCEGTMTMLGRSILRPGLEAVRAPAPPHSVPIPDPALPPSQLRPPP